MRKVSLLLFLVILGVFGAPSSNFQQDQRVVGGSVAPEGAFPHQVIIKQHQSFICSGSIIDATTILTVAQCAHGNLPIPVTVVVGTNQLLSGGREHAVRSVRIHEDYDPLHLTNAVAIFKVDPPIEFSDKAQPIQIETSYVGGGVRGTFSGWGMTSYPVGSLSNDLRFINTKTISFEDCKKRYKDIQEVVDSEICTLADNEGGCHGDDGGPLVIDGKLVGNAHWGWPCNAGYPDIYTRLSSYTDWIDKNRK